MDTSLSKALLIAAGVLVAMLVIVFMVYSFNQMSQWTDAQKEELSAEQTQKFNKEYEVYDKDLMYGVDVISCLNKARSNNDRVDDGTYSDIYKIDVEIKFNSDLLERVRIYLMQGKECVTSTDLKIKSGLKMRNTSAVKRSF